MVDCLRCAGWAGDVYPAVIGILSGGVGISAYSRAAQMPDYRRYGGDNRFNHCIFALAGQSAGAVQQGALVLLAETA